MKILIAEDDVVSRRLLESVLAKLGYEVLSTENGRDAIKASSAACVVVASTSSPSTTTSYSPISTPAVSAGWAAAT